MKKLTRKLFISVLVAVFAFVALGTSTYAWITMSTTAEVTAFEAEVSAGEAGIELSENYDACAPETSAVFGHGGALGGEGFVDREKGIAVGFVKNHVTATHPVHPVRDQISEALGIPLRHW